MKTDNVKSPDEFNILVDEALAKFPNNQNMPLYKATVLMSLGKKDEALEYYKALILKSPSKCYLWNQASELVEEVDLKIALLCKAISVECDESFIGGCRLNLAKAFSMSEIAFSLFFRLAFERRLNQYWYAALWSFSV